MGLQLDAVFLVSPKLDELVRAYRRQNREDVSDEKKWLSYHTTHNEQMAEHPTEKMRRSHMTLGEHKQILQDRARQMSEWQQTQTGEDQLKWPRREAPLTAALLAARTSTPKYHDNWKGRKGDFATIFLINDQRNKNGWRATWESIKQNAEDFIDKPGIRFLQCESGTCDLDHTDGPTYESSRRIQEQYRVSNIVDIVLDESTHTAYGIHEAQESDTAQRFRDFGRSGGEMFDRSLYVSPAIWPKTGGFEVVGQDGPKELIDVHDWKALHSAFVSNPAYSEVAKVYAQCSGIGESCEHTLKLNDPEWNKSKIDLQTSVLSAKLRILKLKARMLTGADFKESEHPRDDDGKFTEPAHSDSIQKTDSTKAI